MKRTILTCLVLLVVGSVAFTQEQDPGFSNTLYTGVGSGSVINEPAKGSGDDVEFEGFANYFTANIKASNGLTIAGDIKWIVLENGSMKAKILGANFNSVMSPIANLDLGVGTNLDWEVGPEPFSGPTFTSYEVSEYAGLGIFTSPSVGVISNHFAQDALAIRYSLEDVLVVGAALNGGLSGSNTAGIGAKLNITDLLSLGFAYNGSFKSSGNIFYLGSSLYLVDGFDIDIWTNFAIDLNTSIGGRLVFHKNNFRFKPEFTATFWDQENKGNSMFAAIVAEMSISDEVLAGVNASWGLGSDANTEVDTNDSGARLTVTPHIVWNISDNNRLSMGVNIMPVWWQDDTSEFFWSIPVSWRVLF